MKKTEVVFRKYKDGAVVAIFPNDKLDTSGNVTTYMHVGQHGAGSLEYMNGYLELALPEEYADLKRELEEIGYSLKVVGELPKTIYLHRGQLGAVTWGKRASKGGIKYVESSELTEAQRLIEWTLQAIKGIPNLAPQESALRCYMENNK